jgi:hypothetical protein
MTLRQERKRFAVWRAGLGLFTAAGEQMPIRLARHRYNSVKLLSWTLSRVPHLSRLSWLLDGWRSMTGHSELAITPRDRFLQAAKKELAAFEQKEREFRNRVRKERAEELQLPADAIERMN